MSLPAAARWTVSSVEICLAGRDRRGGLGVLVRDAWRRTVSLNWLFVVMPVILGAILLAVVLSQGRNPSLLASVIAGEQEGSLVADDDETSLSPKSEPV